MMSISYPLPLLLFGPGSHITITFSPSLKPFWE